MKNFNHKIFFLLSILVFSCNSNKIENHQDKKSTDADSTNANKTFEIETLETKLVYKLVLKDFIPKNYALLDSSSGNLNLDEYKDYVMVLKKIDEEKISDVVEHPEKRPLLILIGQKDGSFKQVRKNNNSVYCVDCGGVMGDPYTGLSLEKGSFTINHYAGSSWRWTKNITYNYSEKEKDWFLQEVKSSSFHASDPEKVEGKVLTKKDFGKVTFQNYDIYKDKEE